MSQGWVLNESEWHSHAKKGMRKPARAAELLLGEDAFRMWVTFQRKFKEHFRAFQMKKENETAALEECFREQAHITYVLKTRKKAGHTQAKAVQQVRSYRVRAVPSSSTCVSNPTK